MKRFSALVRSLDRQPGLLERARLLAGYFRGAADAEASWAAVLLMGRGPGRLMTAQEASAWLQEASGLPEWLVAVCNAATEDPGETAALALPSLLVAEEKSLQAVMEAMTGLRRVPAADRKGAVMDLWQALGPESRLVLNTLLKGEVPVLVQAGEVARAVAEAYGGSARMIEHLLAGEWDPAVTSLRELAAGTSAAADHSRPYPFARIDPLVCDLTALGDAQEWLVTWQLEGVRVQLVRRAGDVFLWAVSGELLSSQHPDLVGAALALPLGTVLEGTLVALKGDSSRPPGRRSARGRQRVQTVRGRAVALRTMSIRLVCSDLFEQEGADISLVPFQERARRLRALIEGSPGTPALEMQEFLSCGSWEDVAGHWASARSRGAAGLRLHGKRAAAGDADAILEWAVEPLVVSAVLLYAEQGLRTGTGFLRFTVAGWHKRRLVPLASVDPVLPVSEMGEIGTYIMQNTVERFGPVRTVQPGLVFDIAFDAVEPSARTKSGVILRGARLLRWRHDLAPESATTVEEVRSLLPGQEPPMPGGVLPGR